MATNLNFVKNGIRYECDIVADSEPTAIQVDREEKADFTVYGSIDDMAQVPLYSTSILQNILFQLDVPEGMKVKLVSWSPVTKCRKL